MLRRLRIFAAVYCAALMASTVYGLAQDAGARPDLMTFAYGVLPVSVDTGGANLKTGMGEAMRLIDGNPVGSSITPKPAAEGDFVEFTYALPAATMFDRLAVPRILETPSPSQTFFRNIEVLGATSSVDGPYVLLGSAVLSVHEEAGQVTELTLAADAPAVSWVRVRLWDGLDVQRDKTFFEFSELIGNGQQASPAMSERFSGVWKGRGVKIELAQEGPAVTGCYDGNSKLTGTVEGRVLRAVGQNPAGIVSQFIAIVGDDGALRGLRSANGAPFRQYDGDISNKSPVCLAPEPPTLGCGDIIHGIGFGYDSDVIRPDSAAILQTLYAGLSDAGAGRIEIVGHSSSEGSADYNRDLSKRRAASVVAALVTLGLDPAILSASGMGEDAPIASNDDEAGRSLNRRVEIQCTS